jgi:ferrous iron transport protein A
MGTYDVTFLSDLGPGEMGTVHHLASGRGFVARLVSLGFVPGAELTMVQNFGRGPVIVLIRDTHIALGRGEAGRIQVLRKGTHRQ